MPYAINATGWRAVDDDFTEEDLALGETLTAEIPQWLMDAFAAQLVLSEATAQLSYLARQANAQITSLQGRVDALNDAVVLDMATPEEETELPGRLPQLKAWKTCRILLGRVNTKATWPATPEWPEMPEPFTEEMSMEAPAIS